MSEGVHGQGVEYKWYVSEGVHGQGVEYKWYVSEGVHRQGLGQTSSEESMKQAAIY